MKKKLKVLITWKYFYYSLNKFKKTFRKKNIKTDYLIKKQGLSEKDLLKIISKYDGMISGDDQITSKVLDNAIKLKVISKWGTGVDSINTNYAKKKGIKVFNTPGAFTEEVATYAVGLMITLSRRLIDTHECSKQGNWKHFSGFSLKNKKLGIIGYGQIGKRIAEISKKLGIEILVNDINTQKKKEAKKKKFQVVSLNKLLSNSNIIILAPDLNKTSNHLINLKNLKYIKKKPIIINVSRGLIVSEKAILKALKKKIVQSVGLDVFENEPLKKNNPLLNFKSNFYGTHNAFNTIESVNRVNESTMKNLLKGLKRI